MISIIVLIIVLLIVLIWFNALGKWIAEIIDRW